MRGEMVARRWSEEERGGGWAGEECRKSGEDWPEVGVEGGPGGRCC